MKTKKTFTYGVKKYVQLLLCFGLVGMFFVMLTTGKLRPGDWSFVVILSAAVFIGCALSLTIFLDVIVSDEGVSKPFYGLRGRCLKWESIDCVTYHARDSGGLNYSVRPGKRSLLRSIYFTSSINNIAELTDILNTELRTRGIPIFKGPGDARTQVDHLPSCESEVNR